MNALRALTRLLSGAQATALDAATVGEIADEMERRLSQMENDPKISVPPDLLEQWAHAMRRLQGTSLYARLGDVAKQHSAMEQDAQQIRLELEAAPNTEAALNQARFVLGVIAKGEAVNAREAARIALDVTA